MPICHHSHYFTWPSFLDPGGINKPPQIPGRCVAGLSNCFCRWVLPPYGAAGSFEIIKRIAALTEAIRLEHAYEKPLQMSHFVKDNMRP